MRLVALAGRRREPLEAAAKELGFERWTTSWEDLLGDPEVDAVANLNALDGHFEPTLGRLRAGKAVFCEKPLAATLDDARTLRDAAEEAGVTNAVGFNYRYVPAVALAKELVDAGRAGELRHYRALYLQDYQVAGGQPRSSGGAGAVLDYAHLVDMLRFLVGEPQAVTARTASFVSDVDDAYAAILELEGGALATLESSRVASGWQGRHRIELNGSDGSIWWDMEDPNRSHVFLFADERERIGGFRDVIVTQLGPSCSWRSGGRRDTCSGGSTASSTNGVTFSPRYSRTEPYRRGKRASRTATARPFCARRSTRPRGKGGASRSQRPQRRSEQGAITTKGSE